jgi:hypothetical protein
MKRTFSDAFLHNEIFVEPVPTHPPQSLWEKNKVDFFVAVLTQWDIPRLRVLLEILEICVTKLIDDGALCNTEALMDIQVPVIYPTLFFLPFVDAVKHFLELTRDGNGMNNEIISMVVSTNIRALFLIGFVLDFRIRACVMTPDPGIHGVLGTRPPEARRVWNLFVDQFNGLPLRFVNDLRDLEALTGTVDDEDNNAFYQSVDKTQEFVLFVIDWYLTQQVPVV